jgi:hypothetical protein
MLRPDLSNYLGLGCGFEAEAAAMMIGRSNPPENCDRELPAGPWNYPGLDADF